LVGIPIPGTSDSIEAKVVSIVKKTDTIDVEANDLLGPP
jgi:hypothetical protein